MKFFKIVVLAILVSLSSFSMASAQATKTAQTVETSKTIKTKVKGVTCSNDLKTISDNVKKVKGVSTCKASKAGPTTTFEIVYDPTKVTEKEIHAAIQGTGGCQNPNDRPYKVKQ